MFRKTFLSKETLHRVYSILGRGRSPVQVPKVAQISTRCRGARENLVSEVESFFGVSKIGSGRRGPDSSGSRRRQRPLKGQDARHTVHQHTLNTNTHCTQGKVGTLYANTPSILTHIVRKTYYTPTHTLCQHTLCVRHTARQYTFYATHCVQGTLYTKHTKY